MPTRRKRKARRRYESPVRRARAEDTRRRIAAAASALFAARGYAATTVGAIARAARVAEPTVYVVYGSKRALLFALLEEREREADVAGLARRLAGASNPRAQLHLLVEFGVRLVAGAEDLFEMVRAAAGESPDASALWREAEARRRRGQAALVRAWAQRGALRRGTSAADAHDVLWALTGPDVYRSFVVGRGWSRARFARWLESAIAELLFAPDARPRPSRTRRRAAG